MRKINKMIVVALAAVMAFTSCRKEDDPDLFSGNTKAGTEFTAHLGINAKGGITIVEEPKAGGMTSISSLIYDETNNPNGIFTEKSLIGIQITELSGENDVNERIIAGGLFKVTAKEDDKYILDNLEVTLRHDYQYLVEATVVCDGDASCNKTGGGIGAPFAITEGEVVANTSIAQFAIKDDVAEFEGYKFSDLSADAYHSDNGGKVVNDRRFYFKNKIKADFNDPQLDINMDCVSFELHYEVKNAPKSSPIKFVTNLKTADANNEEKDVVLSQVIYPNQLYSNPAELNAPKIHFEKWYTLPNISRMWNDGINVPSNYYCNYTTTRATITETTTGNTVKTVEGDGGTFTAKNVYKVTLDMGKDHFVLINADTETTDGDDINLSDVVAANFTKDFINMNQGKVTFTTPNHIATTSSDFYDSKFAVTILSKTDGISTVDVLTDNLLLNAKEKVSLDYDVVSGVVYFLVYKNNDSNKSKVEKFKSNLPKDENSFDSHFRIGKCQEGVSYELTREGWVELQKIV